MIEYSLEGAKPSDRLNVTVKRRASRCGRRRTFRTRSGISFRGPPRASHALSRRSPAPKFPPPLKLRRDLAKRYGAKAGRVARVAALARSAHRDNAGPAGTGSRAPARDQRGQRASGTVVRSRREVQRSRGDGAQWSRSSDGRVRFVR
jgi:hypothetical protein